MLCERLRMNQNDVSRTRSALGLDRLERLDNLAEKANLEHAEQRELEDGIRDILLYQGALLKAEALEGLVSMLVKRGQTIQETSLGAATWLNDLDLFPHLEKALGQLDPQRGAYFLSMLWRKDAPESNS